AGHARRAPLPARVVEFGDLDVHVHHRLFVPHEVMGDEKDLIGAAAVIDYREAEERAALQVEDRSSVFALEPLAGRPALGWRDPGQVEQAIFAREPDGGAENVDWAAVAEGETEPESVVAVDEGLPGVDEVIDVEISDQKQPAVVHVVYDAVGRERAGVPHGN